MQKGTFEIKQSSPLLPVFDIARKIRLVKIDL